MNIKKLSAALLTLVIIAVPLMASACSLGMVNSIVDHKTISGTRDNIRYTILLNRPVGDGKWIVVKDRDFAGYFSDSDNNAVIGEEMGQWLNQYYSNIEYYVNILPYDSSDEGTRSYKVSREEFNKALVGSAIN